jgi:Holliday junction DNA helicase RuvA
MLVREDAMLLFGFLTEAERRFFRMLLKVSGFGAKTALSLLSGLSVDELILAVSHQDHRKIIQIPGIGKKTAERLLLELKDRLDKLPISAVSVDSPTLSSTSDILNALIALGYSEREAIPIVTSLPGDISVSDGIRQALQKLSA